jgi:hypothetical protein
VVVPHVRVAGVVESGDAMLVLEQPEVGAVEESADDFSDEALTSLWQQAAKLRAARLAHGAFNLSNVLATESGPMMVRFNRGQLAATSSVLNIDTAELLVATSIAVGPERALAAHRGDLPPRCRSHTTATASVHRAASRDQVHQPDCAKLCRPNRDQYPLLAATRRADR